VPLDWMHLELEEKAQAILDDIEGLEDAEVQSLLEEWRELEGSDDSKLSDVTRLALDFLARKNGAPTSRERARARLQRRGVIEWPP